MNKKMSQSKRGFTIVETLVAITILVIAITGPLSIVSQSLHTSYYSRDEMTAFYLAQEALEYIRNVRDQNVLDNPTDPTKWLNNIQTPTDSTSGSQINCMNTSGAQVNKCNLGRTVTGVYNFQQCDPTGCAPLSFDSTTGLYGGPFTGINSNFTRSIYLNKVKRNGVDEDSKEVEVNIIVNWHTGSVTNTFILHDYLTNWKTENP